MELNVKLDSFEGPLDLLLHLLDKNKVSIYDIPIVTITDQYLEYINEMQKHDLNIVSEFMVMAATLLDIKAKWLLPKDEDGDEDEEGDPRAELVEQLLQYKMYKYMSLELKDMSVDALKAMYKNATIPKEVLQYQEPVDLDKLTENLDMDKLQEIFKLVMRNKKDKLDPIRAGFGKIKKEVITLDDKMKFIREYATSAKRFSFKNLLEQSDTRDDVVVTFLAILEFMKSGFFSVSQESLFGDIMIEVKEEENKTNE